MSYDDDRRAQVLAAQRERREQELEEQLRLADAALAAVVALPGTGRPDLVRELRLERDRALGTLHDFRRVR